MFINEFISNLKNSQEINEKTSDCLFQNLNQLLGHLSINDEKFQAEINDHLGIQVSTGEWSKRLESLIRKRMNEEKDSNGIDKTQSFYMIVSLSLMLFVS